jgi:hypothetical protein
LSAIRSLARPRFHAFRATLLSALGIAAVVLGLLAMHSSGIEHASPAELPVAAPAHAVHTARSDTPTAANTATTTVLATAVATTAQCDEACMHNTMDGAAMVMTCTMLLMFAALIVFARPAASHRRLMAAGGRMIAFVHSIPPHLHRPDLTVLSISRT